MRRAICIQWLGLLVALASLFGTFGHALPALAGPYKPGKVQEEPKVFGSTAKPVNLAPGTAKQFTAVAPVWPGRSSAEVSTPTALMRAKGDGGLMQADGLPVSVD